VSGAAVPEAEVEVGESLVHELLSSLPERLGHLRTAPVGVGGAGWDNAVWRVGDRHALRLPVSAQAAGALEHEARWSEVVSAPLRAAGIRVPRPVHRGLTPTHHPWPWLLVEWVPGEVVTTVRPTERGRVAELLTQGLPALHRPAPLDAPVNPGRGTPLSVRHSMTLRAAARAGPYLGGPTVAALLDLVEEAKAAPSWPRPHVWCHGDLHDLNLVLDTLSDPAGVGIIDFGDLTRGDPAVDLRVLWTTFEATLREGAVRRLEASGAYDKAVWRRARGWAAAFVLAVAGDERGRAVFAEVIDHTREQLGCP
jgi:aminoglycoside phosphotransferase (APT) family kinase protein